MADPNGFQKIRERQLPPDRPVAERLQDWSDVHAPLPGGQPWLREQASRCMDCGVPFCHFGCPLGNLIPEWNDLVWRGKLADAIERMHATNNFPEFTGRVCPAPCESACVLGLIEPPVTIRNIEMGIADDEFSEPLVPQMAARLTGHTVAVVGSGPAGLACAQQLTRAGHTVVVFERADAVGGLLRYGIPDFKLEKHLIDRRVAQMKAEGTRFQTSTNIGTDITWDDLQRRFDAVVCAVGSTVPIDLPVPGRQLNGIHFAMDYLIPANQAAACSKPSVEEGMTRLETTFPRHSEPVLREVAVASADARRAQNPDPSVEEGQSPVSKPRGAQVDSINAAGKNVVIIGGGDTGSDCLGTALRQGAKSVTTLQVFDQPPVDRPAHQPWPTMPMVFKLSSSHEEGGTVEYLANTVEFVDDGSGNVSALKVARTQFGDNGSIGAEPGSEWDLPADLVLLAIGFRHPDTKTLTNQLGLELNSRGNVARDPNFRASSNIESSPGSGLEKRNNSSSGGDGAGGFGFFVCGDAGRGQSLVVWAIAEGRSCAAAVDTYLQGTTELPAPIKATTSPLTLASAA